MSVAPSNGIAVFLPIAVIASIRGLPRFKSTRIPSIITMALSTNIPIAKINVANDTRCMDPSATPNRKIDPATVMIKLKPIITPLLKPMVSIKIATTMITDSTKLIKCNSQDLF